MRIISEKKWTSATGYTEGKLAMHGLEIVEQTEIKCIAQEEKGAEQKSEELGLIRVLKCQKFV